MHNISRRIYKKQERAIASRGRETGITGEGELSTVNPYVFLLNVE